MKAATVSLTILVAMISVLPAAAAYSPGTGHSPSTMPLSQGSSGTQFIVNSTEYLSNESTVQGNVNYYSSTPGPAGLFYSDSSGQLYVASNISSIYSVNPQTHQTAVNSTFTKFPTGMVYVNEYRDLFLIPGMNNLTRWNPANGSIVNVSVGPYPQGLAYDPSISSMFVTVTGQSSLVAVNISTMNVTYRIPLRFAPFGVAYDQSSGYIYITYEAAGLISVYNPGTRSFVSNITAGGSPYEIASAPGAGKVFVSDNGLNRVDIINSQTQKLVGTVQVGSDPTGIAFDAWTGNVVVANTYSLNVTVIDAASGKVTQNIGVGSQPYAIAATGNGTIAVGNHGSDSLSFLSPVSGALVTFQEVGLPIGTHWNVTVNGNTRVTDTGSIGFDVHPGQINYTVASEKGYYFSTPGHARISGITVISVGYHSVQALHNEIILIAVFVGVLLSVSGLWLYFKKARRGT